MCLLIVTPHTVPAGPFGVMLHSNYLTPESRIRVRTSLTSGLCCKVLAAEREYRSGRDIAREIDAPIVNLGQLDLNRVAFERLREMHLDSAARDKKIVVLVVPDASDFRRQITRRGRSRIQLPELQLLGFDGSFGFRLSA